MFGGYIDRYLVCKYGSHQSCLQFFAEVPGNQATKLSDGEIYLLMDDATRVTVVAVGDVSLSFSGDRTLILKDCLYVPSISRDLIYVSKLVKDSYSVYFNKFVVIKYNKHFIYFGSLVDDLYIINPISPKL